MKYNSIQTSMVLRVVFAFVLLIVACFILYSYQKKIITKRIEHEAHRLLVDSLNQRMEKKYDVGVTNAITAASYSNIGQLLLSGERGKLLEAFKKLGNIFKEDSNFKGIKIQIFDADARTFLRTWKADKHGDISPPVQKILNEVLRQKKALAAFVADTDGVLLRGTAPIRNNGEIVGFLQFLQGVGSVSRDYQAEELDYLLLVNESAVNEAPQLRNNKKVGAYWLANDSWFTDEVVSVISGLDLELFKNREYIRGNGHFAIATPLKDVLGQTIGLNVLAMPESVLQQKINEAMRATLMLIGIAILGSLLLLLIVLYTLGKSVLRPLSAVNAYASEVAQGNWDATPKGTFRFELAELKDALLLMVEKLRILNDEARQKGEEAQAKALEAERALGAARENEHQVQQLVDSMQRAAGNAESISRQVLDAMKGLSDEVEQVKDGMEVQKERMTETAVAMDEMNSTVIEVARNASDAAANASESQKKAQTGAAGVRRSVQSIEAIEHRVVGLKDTMSALGDKADNIGKILQVITDIADQTNLLALNAAIEAARAGDAGRGFAVVADEVRKLAEKTMSATREVDGAIRSIQEVAKKNIEAVESTAKDIVESTRAATEAGSFMEEIVDIVQQTAVQVDSIATASEEQSATSEQINRAVGEVSRVASDTTEGMVRSAGSLARMSSLIGELDSIIQSMSSSHKAASVHTGDGPLVVWTDALSVGVPKIDAQHKRLVDYINQLNDAMRANKSHQVLVGIVEKLKNYVVEHFSSEEDLFSRSAYPDVASHKRTHEKFVEKIATFENDLKKGRVTVQIDVLNFLKDWLVKHIMGTDKQYGPYVTGTKRMR